MIHQYKLGGYNVVLDICSGAVHVVDDVAYDIIGLFENNSRGEVIEISDYTCFAAKIADISLMMTVLEL